MAKNVLGSSTSYTGDGNTSLFSISFALGTINVDQIKVYLDDVLKTNITDYTIINNDSQVQFTTAPADGVNIDIRREQDDNSVEVDYQDTKQIKEKNLDNSNKALYYLTHELFDGWLGKRFKLRKNLNANNKKIINIKDATSAQDVPSYQQLLDVANGTPVTLTKLEYDTVAEMKTVNVSAGVLVSTRGYYLANGQGSATYLVLAPTITGSHTGSNNTSVLTDSTKSWGVNTLIGRVISNTTDGSTATIIANTATTVTATLSGGTDNDWDTSDIYSIAVTADEKRDHTLDNNNVAVLISDTNINPRQFGARGDGVTDDTVIMQNVLDYAVTNNKDVYIAHTYLVTNIYLYLANNISIYGGGIIKGGLELRGEYLTATTVDYYSYNVNIKDITIDGNGGSYCLYLESSWFTTISNVTFTNADIGIRILASIRDNISECKFTDINQKSIYQYSSVRAADIIIADNEFAPTEQTIVLQHMDGLNVNNNVFFGSQSIPTKNHLYFFNNDEVNNWVRIQDNTFFEIGDGSDLTFNQNNYVGAIYAQETYFQQAIISGNHFGWCYKPIYLYGSTNAPDTVRRNGNLHITNNIIEQVQDKRGECHSVYILNGGLNIKISDNTIWKTGGNQAATYDAIYVDNARVVDVTNNTILNEGATTHRYGVHFDNITAGTILDNIIYGTSGIYPTFIANGALASITERNSIVDYATGGQSEFYSSTSKRINLHGGQGDVVHVRTKDLNAVDYYNIINTNSSLQSDDQVGVYMDARIIYIRLQRFSSSTVFAYSAELAMSGVTATKTGTGTYTVATGNNMYKGFLLNSTTVGTVNLRHNNQYVIDSGAVNSGTSTALLELEITDSSGVATDIPINTSVIITARVWMRD